MDQSVLRVRDGFSRQTITALLAGFNQGPMTFRIIQLPSAQATIAYCLGKTALPSLWICFGRYRLRIGARQTVDRDAQPERRAEELHGLRIPADFVGRETPCNIRQPAKSKRYEPGMSINPLLTLKRDCRNADHHAKA